MKTDKPTPKEVKRQAIIAKINALPHLQIESGSYLSEIEAMQVVGAVMYPDGVQTEAQFAIVTSTT